MFSKKKGRKQRNKQFTSSPLEHTVGMAVQSVLRPPSVYIVSPNDKGSGVHRLKINTVSWNSYQGTPSKNNRRKHEGFKPFSKRRVSKHSRSETPVYGRPGCFPVVLINRTYTSPRSLSHLTPCLHSSYLHSDGRWGRGLKVTDSSLSLKEYNIFTTKRF